MKKNVHVLIPHYLVTLMVFTVPIFSSHAEVVLPGLFTDNMVLQKERPISVWGWASPGEKVTLNFHGEQRETTADKGGRWKVSIEPFEAGGPFDMEIRGRDVVTIKNVLIGDVWVCAGQSNMQAPVRDVIDAQKEIAEANFPKIRLFTVGMEVAGRVQEDVSGRNWDVCGTNTISRFSAVGYFFGRELHQKQNIPIGLINCSWFGTSIIGWTSRHAYETNAVIRPILDNFLKVQKIYPDWEDKMDEYHRKIQSDHDPQYQQFNDSAPTGIFNAMIAPLTSFPIRGIIWYQGEADFREPERYRQHLPIVVSDWRRLWDQGDFPFLYVQIAYCHYWGGNWAHMCEAQLRAASVIPNSAMVVINDLHDNYEQHPRMKQGVGERLALATRSLVYGEKQLNYHGPLYDRLKIEGNRARVEFAHANGGIVATDPRALSGFQIAGESRKFYPAQAVIEENTILVSSDSVIKPVAVRYNWGNPNPVCALFNHDKLPMSAFRTDDWTNP